MLKAITNLCSSAEESDRLKFRLMFFLVCFTFVALFVCTGIEVLKRNGKNMQAERIIAILCGQCNAIRNSHWNLWHCLYKTVKSAVPFPFLRLESDFVRFVVFFCLRAIGIATTAHVRNTLYRWMDGCAWACVHVELKIENPFSEQSISNSLCIFNTMRWK